MENNATTQFHLSVVREHDGQIVLCRSLNEDEGEEMETLAEYHPGCKLLKFVTLEADEKTVAVLNALDVLCQSTSGCSLSDQGTLDSAFSVLIKSSFDLGREFPK